MAFISVLLKGTVMSIWLISVAFIASFAHLSAISVVTCQKYWDPSGRPKQATRQQWMGSSLKGVLITKESPLRRNQGEKTKLKG